MVTPCIASTQLVAQVVDISKLFNPQSYLTAIKQICCQDTGAELDKLQVFTDVTKKEPKQIEASCKDGAYVSGMYLEGRFEVRSIRVCLGLVWCPDGRPAPKLGLPKPKISDRVKIQAPCF